MSMFFYITNVKTVKIELKDLVQNRFSRIILAI